MDFIKKYIWGQSDALPIMSKEEAMTVLENCQLDKEKLQAEAELLAEEMKLDEAVVKEIPIDKCFQRSGEVTYINEHYGLIDGQLSFDNLETYNLREGSVVTYVAYQDKDLVRVVKILTDNEDNWETAEELRQVIHKTFVGKITKRIGRTGLVQPGNIKFDLNKISSGFIPLVGDHVEVLGVAEINEDNVGITEKQPLLVKKISPIRFTQICDMVRKYDLELEIGIIKNGKHNQDVFFTIDACTPGFVPIVGDKVNALIIESDQDRFVWRALKVYPSGDQTNKQFFTTEKRIEAELFNDKCGLIVTRNVTQALNKIGQTSRFEINITNTGCVDQTLEELILHTEETQICLLSPELPSRIKPTTTLVLKFECCAKIMGITNEMYTLNFGTFPIARFIHIKVIPNYDRASLINNYYHRNERTLTRYARKSFGHLSTNQDVVIGERPVRPPSFITNKLPMFEVPERIALILFKQMEKNKYVGDIPIQDISECLLYELNIKNYADRFHNLLYLEELALIINMRRYDMESTIFIPHDGFLILEVPDLSERRPSVIVGDKVIISNPDKTGTKYEGFVHKTQLKHLHIKFNSTFHNTYKGELYSVEFHSSRTNFRRYHHCVDLAQNLLGKSFLFPTSVPNKNIYVEFEVEDDDTPTTVNSLASKSEEEAEIKSKYESTRNTETKQKSPSKILSLYNSNISNNTVVSTEAIQSTNIYKKMTETAVQFQTEIDESPPKTESSVPKSKYARLVQAAHQKSKTRKDTPNNSHNKSAPEINSHDNSTLEMNSHNATAPELYSDYLCPEMDINLTTPKLVWFDKKLNHFQKEAVKNILKGEARPLPYFIFGPPGTGKTVTLIEAILQILRLIPDSRLLVCAPSNSAADLISMRLIDSGVLLPGDFVRLIAYRCITEDSIPERLKPYCVTGDLAREGSREKRNQEVNGFNTGVQASSLGRHRITVGTCMVVGAMYTMGFPRGHFSHILVDEAGQATEPEIMIPLSLLDINTAQAVLAGDPLQLGPCVFSLLSKNHGLSVSFFERLINRFPYERDLDGFRETNGYDPRLVTRLVYNYRSLPEILSLTNKLFYNNELIAVVDENNGPEADLLREVSSFLPKRTRPSGLPAAVVFHGVRGENFQTSDCPSWFNPVEAGQVCVYVAQLYRKGIKPSDIGIITPYIKQGQEVRQNLIDIDLALPKIGSVEEFQGQEFKVVILSTVRSNETGARNDAKYGLGFIASPRRLNVAISRAQSLLIIVGNPHLLMTDTYWRTVLIYACQIDGYRGCDMPQFTH